MTSNYLADVRTDLETFGSDLGEPDDQGPSVTLTDWDPDTEIKVVAAGL